MLLLGTNRSLLPTSRTSRWANLTSTMNLRWLRMAQRQRQSRGLRSGSDERTNISFGLGAPSDRPQLSQLFQAASQIKLLTAYTDPSKKAPRDNLAARILHCLRPICWT